MFFTWLLGYLSPSVLSIFIGCKQLCQVWEKIHKRFYSHLKARVHQLRSELKNTKKGNRSVSECLILIRAIIDSLQTIGDLVSEQDHIDTVLEGIPDEYNFVMIIYGRVDPPSIYDIEALLQVQDA